MNEPKIETVAQLLGTDDTEQQLRLIERLYTQARTPVFGLALYLDPRQEKGFGFHILGPDTPLPVLRQMLQLAQETLTNMEVEKRVQAQTTPTSEHDHT